MLALMCYNKIMSESAPNHGETSSNAPKSTQWDELQQVPFNASNEEAALDYEKTQQNFETELTSPEAVLDDIQKFSIKEGKVYSKATGEEELDEDTILRVKTSRLLYNEAKETRNNDRHSFGKRFKDRGPEFYINNTLKRYGFKDEDPKHVDGKMLKDLVDNGTHHGGIFADNLSVYPYNMFVGKKGDLGRALLKRRLKQHGLAMNNLDISIDTSNFIKDGISTVDIQVDTSPLAQAQGDSALESPDNANHTETLHHPAAEQLSRLEADLAEAEKNQDETAINGYRNAMKMVVERNRLEVTPEEWQSMDDDQKERFFRLKMKEERILGDHEAYNYWRANLDGLKNQ